MHPAGAAAKDTQASSTPPGLLVKIVTGSDGSLCRGLYPSGAVWADMSGMAAAAGATVKIAAAPAERIPLQALPQKAKEESLK